MDELERIRKEKMEKMLKSRNLKLTIETNDSDFQEKVIEQSKTIPVLVDFWAQWCMPCLALSPVLERLVEEYNGRFILAKADVEQTETMANTYDIRNIPNVKLFKSGRPVAEFIGVETEAVIRRMLDENLG